MRLDSLLDVARYAAHFRSLQSSQAAADFAHRELPEPLTPWKDQDGKNWRHGKSALKHPIGKPRAQSRPNGHVNGFDRDSGSVDGFAARDPAGTCFYSPLPVSSWHLLLFQETQIGIDKAKQFRKTGTRRDKYTIKNYTG